MNAWPSAYARELAETGDGASDVSITSEEIQNPAQAIPLMHQWGFFCLRSLANIIGRSWVLSDKLCFFLGLDGAGMHHIAIAAGGGRPTNPLSNTGLGNVKNEILSTSRSCDLQHADRHLAAVEWRFSRCLDLAKHVTRLARVAAITPPVPNDLSFKMIGEEVRMIR